MLRNRLWGFTAILILGMTAIIPNVAAQGNTFELRYVIGDKLNGDTRPIGLGGQMELLADGSIVFVGIIAGNETGLFQASGNRLITSVARIGNPIPVGTNNNNTIRLVPDPRTNFHVDNNGLVYFNARIGEFSTEPLVSSSTTPSSLLFSSFVETITSPVGDRNNPLIASLLNVSSNGHILANVTTKSGNPALEPGLYAGANASSISPVVLRHSPAPGVPGTTFQSFGIGSSTIIKDDGTIYFGATLFAPDGSFPASIWTTAGGNLHLIARDEMAIPGLAGGVINIKGGSSPNFKILPVDGQRTIIFGEERATADPGTPQARVFSSHALFLDTAGGNLTPLALVAPFQNTAQIKNDLDSILRLPTGTTAGDITFLSIFDPVTGSDGTTYFTGLGRIDANIGVNTDEKLFNGIWKWDPVTGDISLAIEDSQFFVVPSRPIPFSNATPLAVDSAGGLVFTASENSAPFSLWYLSDDGQLSSIAKPGDVINGFTVAEALGRAQFNNNNQLLVGLFVNDITGDSRPDNAFFVATLAPSSPGKDFIWSGACGDSNWHSGCGDSNWNNVADSTPAQKSPGDEAGTENATIENQDVVISDRAVHLNSLTATGSLEVNQTLTLEGASTIEDIALKADLAANAPLSLTGVNNVWSDGMIAGTGKVTVASGAMLAISPAGDSLDLKTTLEILGEATQTGGTVNLMGAGGKLVIAMDGTYNIERGAIVDFTDGVHIENSGSFFKDSADTATIDAFFDNKPSGRTRVIDGTLIFTGPSNWAGQLETLVGTTVEFKNSPVRLGDPTGNDLMVDSAGIVRFSGSEVTISASASALFNATGDGRIEVIDGANISGDGKIVNKGNFELIDGNIKADFNNDTSGVFTLVDTAGILLDNTSVRFINNGTVKKTGPGESIVGSPSSIFRNLAFDNNDAIMVGDGTLTFDNATFSFKDGGTVNVARSAKMNIIRGNTRVTGETTFTGNGDLLFGGSVQFATSGILTNEMTKDDVVIGNRLEGGFEIAKGSDIQGNGTIDNFGDMIFASGSITGVTLNNHAGANFSIQGPIEDDRVLDVTFISEGRTFVSTGFSLGANGKISNRNDFTIDGELSITKKNGAGAGFPLLTNSGSDARLIKVGAGDAVIGRDVRFFNDDGGIIEVREGSLTLKGKSVFSQFDTNTKINLSAGSKFILGNGSETGFFGTTTVTGAAGDGSAFVIDGNINLKPESGLQILSDAIWESGDLSLGDGFVGATLVIGSDTEAGQLTINGDGLLEIFNRGIFEVGKNGTVIQQSPLVVNGDLLMEVNGLYRMGEALADIVIGSGAFLIKQTGTLEIMPGKNVFIDKPFIIESGGTVNIKDNATLKIKFIENMRVLKRGNWIVGSGGVVTGAVPEKIDTLANGVTVELNNGSKLFNLPIVEGDFTMDAGSELRLKSADFTVFGDFTNNGLITGNQSSINVDGDFTTNIGSVLEGDGVTINANLSNSGTVSPGASPGVITINGDYTQTSTGVLAIELGGFGAGTEYDQLIVNGTATFEAGSSIEITLLDLDGDGEVFIPRGRSSFDIIVADNLILPTGADLDNLVSVTNAPNGLRVSLAPSTAGAGFGFKLLTVFGSTLLDLGGQFTPGQNNVAAALDGASTGTATDGLLDFALAIDDLGTVAAKQDAIEQASLSFASSLFAISRIGSDAGHDQIDRHFDSLIWAVASPVAPVAKASYAPNNLVAMSYGPAAQGAMNDVGDFIGFAKNLAGNGTSTLSSGDGMGFFVAGSYEFGNYDATLNQTGFDYDGASATIGIDYSDREAGWTVGVSGSASTLNGTIDLGRGTVDGTTYGVSAYGLIETAANVALDGAVSYGWINNDYRRAVTIPGQSFTANGNVDGNYFTATARISWARDYGAGKIGPFGQIRYSRVQLDRSQETGGGDASLIIGSGIEKFTTGQIGLRGAMAYKTDWGLVTPHVSVAWNYVLDQTAPTLTARFVGGPDNSFLIPTDDYDRSGLAVNAGLVIARDGSLSFSLDYQGLLFNKDYRNHSLTGRAKWAF